MSTEEERRKYWEEKKKQYERGQEFINAVKPGDVVRIERYTVTNDSPYSLSKNAHIKTAQSVKIFAIHNDQHDAHPWFTTYQGEAIDAESIIHWRKLSQQQTLSF